MQDLEENDRECLLFPSSKDAKMHDVLYERTTGSDDQDQRDAFYHFLSRHRDRHSVENCRRSSLAHTRYSISCSDLRACTSVTQQATITKTNQRL